MEIKNVHVEQVVPVLQALGEIRNPMLAYRVAMLQQQVNPVVEALAKARTPTDSFQEYSKKRIELCEVHAEKDDLGKAIKERKPAQNAQGWSETYSIKDMDAFTVLAKDLEKTHMGALEEEATRQKSVVELLMSPTELEFTHKIKYSWCKNILTGNALSLLMACDILEMDVDMDEKPVKALSVVEDTEE